MCVCCFQALEDYGTQELSEQNSELETKMEVAKQSLRRAEVTLCVCVCACVTKYGLSAPSAG